MAGERYEDVAGAILAGGESRRMGFNKAFLEFEGRTLVERVAERLSSLFTSVLVVANEVEPYRYLGVPVYPDARPGCGSLGGIYTALLHSGRPYCFVAACDMPFLREEAIRHLVDLREGYDVVVPLVEDYPQTLHALYGDACREPIGRMLEAGEFKVLGFFPQVRVCQVPEGEMRRFDPDLRMFMNLNTPEDLERARRGEAFRGKRAP
ncbi:MAG: molybdenum cofactor guanylyltransferase [Nitrospinota bacterium]